jgi:protein NirF
MKKRGVGMIGYVRLISVFVLAGALTGCVATRGTGDLGLVIERERESALLVETSTDSVLQRIDGLGDLSHASAVFSKDMRHAFIFGRDGGLTKVDLLTGSIDKRVVQAGNSIGGAISADGKYVAVSNYKPGGVKIFHTEDLTEKLDLPATDVSGERSRVVGLVDAPGQIWIVDLSSDEPKITRFTDVGQKPYDALLTPDGRYYIAGLFGEPGAVVLDLWHIEKGPRKILQGWGKGKGKLPVYKMPHLEGWAQSGEYLLLPAVGAKKLIVLRFGTWEQVGEIELAGQPVFAMANPNGRQVWINFAYPDNNRLQVLDLNSLKIVKEMTPGKGVLHMEFTPRGEKVWVSLRDENQVVVYNTADFSLESQLEAHVPSGIFFTARAHKIGL